MKKKIISTLATTLAFLGIYASVHAAVTVPWTTTDTNNATITPNKVNGVNEAIRFNGFNMVSGTTGYYGPSLLINNNGDINATVIPRQGTYSVMSSIVPASGEHVYITDRATEYVGDGTHSISQLFPSVSATSTTGFYGVNNPNPQATLDITNANDIFNPVFGSSNATIMNTQTGVLTLSSGKANNGSARDMIQLEDDGSHSHQLCMGDLLGNDQSMQLCILPSNITFSENGNIAINFGINDSIFGAPNNLFLQADSGTNALEAEGFYNGSNLTYPIIGIGTTSLASSYELTVEQTAAPQLSLSDKAGVAQWVFRNAGSNLYISTTTTAGTATTSTTALTLLGASGRVGISSTTPFARLAVNPVAGDSNGFVVGSSTATNFIVNNSGNVGIGTDVPMTTFDVGGLITTSALSTLSAVEDISQNMNGIGGFEMRNTSNGSSADFRFIVSSDDRKSYLAFSMPSSGNNSTQFGLTRSTIAQIIVNDGTGGSANRTLAMGTLTNAPIVLGTNSAERMRVSSVGLVGIGTTSPYATLSVQSGASSGDAFAIATSSGAAVLGVDNDGHNWTSGPAGAVSSCGTGSGSVVGDDQTGTITTATAAAACTYTFSKAYRKTPVCTVTDDSLVGFADISSISTSAVTFGISSALTGGHLYYQCKYHQ